MCSCSVANEVRARLFLVIAQPVEVLPTPFWLGCSLERLLSCLGGGPSRTASSRPWVG